MTLAISLWKFESPLGLQFPKWELTWECECPFSHSSHTFPTLLDFPSWPAPLYALALVTSPRLRLRYFWCCSPLVKTWFIIVKVKSSIPNISTYVHLKSVTTLILGSRPKQGLAKVRAKNETRESHFMLPGLWEYGKVWGNEPSHSQVHSHFGSWNLD